MHALPTLLINYEDDPYLLAELHCVTLLPELIGFTSEVQAAAVQIPPRLQCLPGGAHAPRVPITNCIARCRTEPLAPQSPGQSYARTTGPEILGPSSSPNTTAGIPVQHRTIVSNTAISVILYFLLLPRNFNNIITIVSLLQGEN